MTINMSVLNVSATMVGYSAIFVPPREQTQHHLIPSHNLPTPIRAEHLLNLLSGYTLSATAYLYNGFNTCTTEQRSYRCIIIKKPLLIAGVSITFEVD